MVRPIAFRSNAAAIAGTDPQAGLDENRHIAARLREMAALLDAQGANPFRAAACEKGAETLEAARTSVRDVFAREGLAGLEALPAIGPAIAAAIGEMLQRGQWSQLDRLGGDVDAEALFCTIPGVGPRLAQRMHEVLRIDTLEALELAAHDGRLAQLPALSGRRAAAIGAALTRLLDRRRRLHQPAQPAQATALPPLAWLLDIDRKYRAGAATNRLPRISPRRFNPDGAAWLPVLHTQRGDWHFTALYSNTARAHELRCVRDWVVIHGSDPSHAETQATVVTQAAGALAGRRVVRGRERECPAWTAAQSAAAAPAVAGQTGALGQETRPLEPAI